ncbi:uncharacterized protein PFLUO_LOCUS6302 [Penicillium psychrofluorescens]|uniref:uncharacterized protein n=1 Tax=Penicillium psychrofluorescens TaxID=3158075 RepID=UPI003CCD669D
MSLTATTEQTLAASTKSEGTSRALNISKPGTGEVKRLHHIPWPETALERRKWQLEQMAGAFRVFAKLGFADGGSGHISLRDPIDTKTFWLNPYGVHFGMLTVSDMVQVDDQGRRVGGADKPVNAAGFMIHSAIHAARPDLHAVCHAHSPHARAWSTFGLPIDMLNQDSCMFYNDLAVYPSFGGVVFAAEEGCRIASAMGPTKKNLLLQNHGSLTAGGTIAEAAAFFIALERACHNQLLVEASLASPRLKKTFVGDEEAEYTKKGTGSPEVMYMQFMPEYQFVLKVSEGDFLQ